MSEDVLLNERGVLVTRTRVVINNETYSVRAIVSVSASEQEQRDVHGGCGFIVVGFIVFVVLGTILGFAVGPVGGVLAAVIFGIFIKVGLGEIYNRKIDYYVVISTTDGRTHRLTTQDSEFQKRVVRAINTAMASQA